MQEEKDVQPSSELISVEEKGPCKATIFVAVLILGLLAGAISVPALWVVIIFALPKPTSGLAARNVLCLAALIDAVLCIRLFRWSRLFAVCFALAAIISLVYCLFISFLSEAVPG